MTPIPVAEWIRVSTDEQASDDRGGIPSQKIACKAIAEKNGLAIQWSFQAEGISGSNVLNSKPMQELMLLCKSGRCKGVVVKEESRLMRPDFSGMALLAFFQENNIILYFESGPTDLRNPNSALMTGIKFNMVAFDKENLKKRTLDARKAIRSGGGWISGEKGVAYGMKLTGTRRSRVITPDPDTIGNIQRLFEDYLNTDVSLLQLSQTVGISYKKCQYALRNTIYTGVHTVKRVSVEYNGYVNWGPEAGDNAGRRRYTKRRILPTEEQLRIRMIPEAEAPISTALFEAVQRRIVERERDDIRKHPDGDRFRYLGRIFCSACGRPFTSYKYKNINKLTGNVFQRDYYVCRGVIGQVSHRKTGGVFYTLPRGSCQSRRLRSELLDAKLDGLFADATTVPVLIRKMREVYKAPKKRDNTTNLKTQIAAGEKAVERYGDLYAWGKLSLDNFTAKMKELDTQLVKARRELATVQSPEDLMTQDDWTDLLDMFDVWAVLRIDERRKIADSINMRFYVESIEKGYHQVETQFNRLTIKVGASHELTALLGDIST